MENGGPVDLEKIRALVAQLQEIIHADPVMQQSVPLREQKSLIPPPTLYEKRLATAIAWTRAGDLRSKVLSLTTLQNPEWNMLLDLYLGHLRGIFPSISSSCIAAGVPKTTALRHLTSLIEAGRIERIDDDFDQRRTFLRLSPETLYMMEELMDQVIESDRRYGLERMQLARPRINLATGIPMSEEFKALDASKLHLKGG